ncbi:MAG: hypothetical protein KAT70_01680, partial [Thermoplasmata archaeon]|nr:hypothetical protein [Thermoplasmata archaeon]
TWLAPDSIRSRIHDILVTVNEGGDVNEVDSGNNLAWRAMVDPRPDLILASQEFQGDVLPQEGARWPFNFTIMNNGTGAFAMADKFSVRIWDEAPDGTVSLLWDSTDVTTEPKTSWDLGPGDSVNHTVSLVLIGVGNHTITMEVDPAIGNGSYGDIWEYDEANNFTFIQEIDAPDILVTMIAPERNADIVLNKEFEISGFISPVPSDWQNVSVVILITLPDGTVDSRGVSILEPSGGRAMFFYYVSMAEKGNYMVEVQATYASITYGPPAPTQFVISEGPTDDEGIPMWMILLIILLIIAPIAAVSLYLYKYGLGILVECGECGALIPVGSTKCPKCNVEFEPDTAKCSVCGSWISMDSPVCPECGAEFTVAEMSLEEYKEKMGKQYKEFLLPYRAKAVEELEIPEEELSDENFSEWWMAQAEYITFEDWLSLEEEKRSAIKPVLCSECNSLNPAGASTCYKCGMSLQEAGEVIEGEAAKDKGKGGEEERPAEPGDEEAAQKAEAMPPAPAPVA